MNRGANFEDLYRNGLDSDSDDSNSDAGGCMFGKANAFDSDDDWSSLDSDLYEPEDKEGDFEYRPLTTAQKSSGKEYNVAGLDVDDDLSVGSDNDFTRASKSNKKWDWVEADEQSVGSDDDFEVQFQGRSNGVYDLKGGQGEVEDFLGGGGGEDDNEDMAFHTDYATEQRTEAFLNEGQEGTRSGGRATQKGGELVETEYLPAKKGAAQRRRVNPAFVAANTQGTAKSRELVELGLARARARSGRAGRTVAEQQAEVEAGLAPRADRPVVAKAERTGKVGVDDERAPLAPAKQARLEAETAETQAQSKARVDRSIAKIRSAMAGAKTEEAREAVEERVLSEIDGISTDLKGELEAIFATNPEGGLAKKLKIIEGQVNKVDSKVKAGLSVAGMITAAGNMLMLEAEYKALLKEMSREATEAETASLIAAFTGASAPPPAVKPPARRVLKLKTSEAVKQLRAQIASAEADKQPPSVPYQEAETGRQVIEIAGITVKPVGKVKSDVYGIGGGKLDKYSPLADLEANKAKIVALPKKTPNRTKVLAQIQRFIKDHDPDGRPPKLPKGLTKASKAPKTPKAGGGVSTTGRK
jgi:hypothetical protein